MTSTAPQAAAARRGERGGARRRPSKGALRAALLFLLPAFILLVALRIVPMFSAIVDSLKQGSMSIDGGQWVGFENFAYLFGDPNFRNVLVVTGLFLLITVPFQLIVAVFLALILVERVPGLGVVRVLVFIPVAAPAAVATVVWGIAYQPQGPINAFLERIGIPAQPFLTSTDQALLSIIVLMSWIGIGYWTLFLIAGLQDVPRELYEAAAIDGAGWWRSFLSITLPNLRRTLAFVVVANTVSSVMAFVPVQILTQGGPAGSTRLIMYDLYNNTFQLGDINLGQTEVVVLLTFLIAVTAVQFRMLNKEN